MIEKNPLPSKRPLRRRNTFTMTPLVWGLLVAFLVVSATTAYLTFAVVRELFSQGSPAEAAEPAQLADNQPTEETFEFNIDQLSPLRNNGGPTPQPWDGSSRVNVLVMGLDYGDWSEDRQGPARTDSMLLFTIDPESRTAGMLSIPRDLWVDIPGYGYSKINTAHYLGELYKIEGEGPGLAMKTVEAFLDLDIHYYAVVDFTTFEDFIDELGGIVVDVPEEISVDPIGPGNTVVLQPGLQTLDGPVALAYARNRDTIGSDFDRSQRQQQVILAIRRRILDLNMLPELIKKSPLLYQKLSSGVRTNFSLNDVIGLAWLASQIPGENIKRGAIGPDQVDQSYSPEGLDILLPKFEEVFRLRDEIFTTTGPVEPAAVATVSDMMAVAPESPTLTPADLVDVISQEAARLIVLNGTTTIGLAAEATNLLQAEGFNVIEAGNADELTEFSSIIDYTGKPYSVEYLIQLLQIQPSRIFSRYDPAAKADIVIILGQDWAEISASP